VAAMPAEYWPWATTCWLKLSPLGCCVSHSKTCSKRAPGSATHKMVRMLMIARKKSTMMLKRHGLRFCTTAPATARVHKHVWVSQAPKPCSKAVTQQLNMTYRC